MQVAPPPQMAQAAPPVPQAPLLFPGWQVLPWQQPAGHEVASHPQIPFRQCCPGMHAGPPSQRHMPPTHESASMPQSTQARPPVPHADTLGDVQVVPAQQPLGHEIGSHMHAPLTQCCPAAQEGPVPH